MTRPKLSANKVRKRKTKFSRINFLSPEIKDVGGTSGSQGDVIILAPPKSYLKEYFGQVGSTTKLKRDFSYF